jgi:7,8-dihydropterin-6-yl-methyl-4-(beta-D-ribofuranosyl)aminobenzene 5'-phosphate synthase
MTTELRRRDFLKTSAAFASLAAAGFSCVEVANAAPIQVPTVDKLSIRVLVDQQHDQFFARQHRERRGP